MEETISAPSVKASRLKVNSAYKDQFLQEINSYVHETDFLLLHPKDPSCPPRKPRDAISSPENIPPETDDFHKRSQIPKRPKGPSTGAKKSLIPTPTRFQRKHKRSTDSSGNSSIIPLTEEDLMHVFDYILYDSSASPSPEKFKTEMKMRSKSPAPKSKTKTLAHSSNKRSKSPNIVRKTFRKSNDATKGNKVRQKNMEKNALCSSPGDSETSPRRIPPPPKSELSDTISPIKNQFCSPKYNKTKNKSEADSIRNNRYPIEKKNHQSVVGRASREKYQKNDNNDCFSRRDLLTDVDIQNIKSGWTAPNVGNSPKSNISNSSHLIDLDSDPKKSSETKRTFSPDFLNTKNAFEDLRPSDSDSDNELNRAQKLFNNPIFPIPKFDTQKTSNDDDLISFSPMMKPMPVADLIEFSDNDDKSKQNKDQQNKEQSPLIKKQESLEDVDVLTPRHLFFINANSENSEEEEELTPEKHQNNTNSDLLAFSEIERNPNNNQIITTPKKEPIPIEIIDCNSSTLLNPPQQNRRQPKSPIKMMTNSMIAEFLDFSDKENHNNSEKNSKIENTLEEEKKNDEPHNCSIEGIEKVEPELANTENSDFISFSTVSNEVPDYVKANFPPIAQPPTIEIISSPPDPNIIPPEKMNLNIFESPEERKKESICNSETLLASSKLNLSTDNHDDMISNNNTQNIDNIESSEKADSELIDSPDKSNLEIFNSPIKYHIFSEPKIAKEEQNSSKSHLLGNEPNNEINSSSPGSNSSFRHGRKEPKRATTSLMKHFISVEEESSYEQYASPHKSNYLNNSEENHQTASEISEKSQINQSFNGIESDLQAAVSPIPSKFNKGLNLSINEETTELPASTINDDENVFKQNDFVSTNEQISGITDTTNVETEELNPEIEEEEQLKSQKDISMEFSTEKADVSYIGDEEEEFENQNQNNTNNFYDEPESINEKTTNEQSLNEQDSNNVLSIDLDSIPILSKIEAPTDLHIFNNPLFATGTQPTSLELNEDNQESTFKNKASINNKKSFLIEAETDNYSSDYNQTSAVQNETENNLIDQQEENKSNTFVEEELETEKDDAKSEIEIKLNAEIEAAIKERNFPPNTIKSLIHSITGVLLSNNGNGNESILENEDTIFAFQERFCSIIEVEIKTNEGEVLNIFPTNLNQYFNPEINNEVEEELPKTKAKNKNSTPNSSSKTNKRNSIIVKSRNSSILAESPKKSTIKSKEIGKDIKSPKPVKSTPTNKPAERSNSPISRKSNLRNQERSPSKSPPRYPSEKSPTKAPPSSEISHIKSSVKRDLNGAPINRKSPHSIVDPFTTVKATTKSPSSKKKSRHSISTDNPSRNKAANHHENISTPTRRKSNISKNNISSNLEYDSDEFVSVSTPPSQVKQPMFEKISPDVHQKPQRVIMDDSESDNSPKRQPRNKSKQFNKNDDSEENTEDGNASSMASSPDNSYRNNNTSYSDEFVPVSSPSPVSKQFQPNFKSPTVMHPKPTLSKPNSNIQKQIKNKKQSKSIKDDFKKPTNQKRRSVLNDDVHNSANEPVPQVEKKSAKNSFVKNQKTPVHQTYQRNERKEETPSNNISNNPFAKGKGPLQFSLRKPLKKAINKSDIAQQKEQANESAVPEMKPRQRSPNHINTFEGKRIPKPAENTKDKERSRTPPKGKQTIFDRQSIKEGEKAQKSGPNKKLPLNSPKLIDDPFKSAKPQSSKIATSNKKIDNKRSLVDSKSNNTKGKGKKSEAEVKNSTGLPFNIDTSLFSDATFQKQSTQPQVSPTKRPKSVASVLIPAADDDYSDD